MTEAESFKLGFLSHCLEQGMSPAEVEQCVEKVAEALDEALSKSASLLDMAGKGVGLATLAAMAAPVAVGAGAGYLAGEARNRPASNVDTFQKEELIREYRRLTRQARDVARQKAVM